MSKDEQTKKTSTVTGIIRPCNGRMYLDTNGELEQVFNQFSALDKVTVTINGEAGPALERRHSICNTAVKQYGDDMQINMLTEEVGELLTAINQFRRGRISRTAVVEEIADVTIMMEQMAIIFGENEVAMMIVSKLARLEERLGKTALHGIG